MNDRGPLEARALKAESELEIWMEVLKAYWADRLAEIAHLRAILAACPSCAHFDPENPETGCVTQQALTYPYCARRTERVGR
jgi:hypothetical protein